MTAIVDPQGVKQLKVMIAVPCGGDQVHVRFALDLAKMVGFMHRERPDVRIADPVFLHMTIEILNLRKNII